MVNTNYIYCSCLVIIIAIFIIETRKPKHPFAGLDIVQLVQKYDYTIETHTVITEDDYILTLHRIPSTTNKNASPILFMHGYTHSATNFIDSGPNNSLALLLNNRGYDIWLGNARGTRWSRKHKTLNPDEDLDFWNFSMHEIGIYDVPAIIDYILSTTNNKLLQYVGYSQGTTVFFILGSEKPHYLSKIKMMTALAPAMYLAEPKGPVIERLGRFSPILAFYFKFVNHRDFLAHDSYISKYMKFICNENSMFANFCLHHLFLLHGYNFEETDTSNLSLIMSNTPAGSAPNQILHIIQLFQSKEFVAFDYGNAKINLRKYGQRTAPKYDARKITTPVALYYASNDWTNMEKVVHVLPNVIKRYQVPSATFNHNDFIYGRDVVKLLYNSVIEEIMKY